MATKSDKKNRGPSRWWVFTINNPTPADDKAIKAVLPQVRYLVFGREVGKERGTPHYQGYLELEKPQRFSWVKKRLPRARIDEKYERSTRAHARNYCMKEDEKPFEYGEWIPDRQGRRSDLVTIQEKLDGGATSLQIAQEHFGSWCRYRKSFEAYRLLKAKNRAIERKVTWLYGATGTGKSRRAHEEHPDAYWKSGQNKWFDGYDGEESVIIDDFRKNFWTFSYMLRLLDRYPMSVENKGGSFPWLAKNIIITAPCHPSEMYDTREDVQQLIRRIDVIERL